MCRYTSTKCAGDFRDYCEDTCEATGLQCKSFHKSASNVALKKPVKVSSGIKGKSSMVTDGDGIDIFDVIAEA